MKEGDLIVVSHRREGPQLAAVVYAERTAAKVRKWLPFARRWTKPVLVASRDFLRYATKDDIRKFDPVLDANGAAVL